MMSVFLLMTSFQPTYAAPGHVDGETNDDGNHGNGGVVKRQADFEKRETPFLPCPPICEEKELSNNKGRFSPSLIFCMISCLVGWLHSWL